MPLYTYECETCKLIFDVRHSIKERLEKCESCGAQDLRRVPSIPFIVKKATESATSAGSLVEKSIKEAREELRREKENLKQAEHE